MSGYLSYDFIFIEGINTRVSVETGSSFSPLKK